MSNTGEQKKFEWESILKVISLLLCTCSLIIIAITLIPVAKWANYQTTCVEQEIKKAPIAWAVRKCNGRSKVYQIKDPTKN